MFIFDEPTTGLHFHDINTLMGSFDRLIKQGHTVIIIEHNMDVIKCADHIIDIGPEGEMPVATLSLPGLLKKLQLVPQATQGIISKKNCNRF